MVNRRLMLAALGVVAVLAMGGSAIAWSSARTMSLTFSGPVGLPGVTLGTGTYLFENAAPQTGSDIVRVQSTDRSKLYFLGFTRRVSRPAALPEDRAIELGETSAGIPPRILIWYPTGTMDGHEFLYKKR